MIVKDLLSACSHKQSHILPDLLESQAAMSNSYPSALCAVQGGSLYHFYDGLWYDPVGTQTYVQEGDTLTTTPNRPVINVKKHAVMQTSWSETLPLETQLEIIIVHLDRRSSECMIWEPVSS